MDEEVEIFGEEWGKTDISRFRERREIAPLIDHIESCKIVVPVKLRGQGLASPALRVLIELCDMNKVTIKLIERA